MPGKVERNKLHNLYFLGFSVAIGILAAVGALVFRELIELFQELFWLEGSSFVDKLIHSPWWMKLLIPPLGGMAAGIVITYLVPEARGPGVPELILSVASHASAIRYRVTFLKALVTGLLIGTGASVGREGPIAQIGASVGSSLAQLFSLEPDLRRVCLASGAAAGIAATFNAPITGTLFAVEIILLDIEIFYISHIIIASVVASVLSRFFWGEFPTFRALSFHLDHYWELSVYLLLGILAGFLSICFVKLIYGTDECLRKLSLPEWVKPGIGGLLLGIIALKIPHVMGVGYETINLSLGGYLALDFALVLILAKTVATSLCIGSGMSGGIFAPSLVLGATLGTIVSLCGNLLFPGIHLFPSNYALAGMGAMVAGTTLAPITAILTLFELTYNYQIILPLMVACISSALVVRLLFGYSAYEMKLLKMGVNIVRGHDAGILRNLLAGSVMVTNYEYLRDSTPFVQIMDAVAASHYPHFMVLNENDELAGVLSLRDLKASLGSLNDLENLAIAADIMTSPVVTVTTMDNLETALHLFERHRVSFLPVTDPGNPLHVLGILKKDDLLRTYEERVLKAQMLSRPL